MAARSHCPTRPSRSGVAACAMACGAAGLTFTLASRPATQATEAPPRTVQGVTTTPEGLAASAAPLAVGLMGGLSLASSRSARRLAARRATNPELTEDFDDEPPFEIRGFSLAQFILVLGFVLVVVSFADYFIFGTRGGGGGIGGLTFIYAVPVLLLGAALQYAELQPVEVETDNDAVGLFESKATTTIRKVKSDVTRHRYGDDAHLDSSLKALGLVGAGGRYPKMVKIIESKAPNGELAFRMLFESKDLPFTTWSDPMTPGR
ncbi:unnamed protein product, partial [Symbiodinium natans]